MPAIAPPERPPDEGSAVGLAVWTVEDPETPVAPEAVTPVAPEAVAPVAPETVIPVAGAPVVPVVPTVELLTSVVAVGKVLGGEAERCDPHRVTEKIKNKK